MKRRTLNVILIVLTESLSCGPEGWHRFVTGAACTNLLLCFNPDQKADNHEIELQLSCNESGGLNCCVHEGISIIRALAGKSVFV